MISRGYNGVVINRGAIIEVPEPWASRFLADGTCVAEAAKKPEASPEPKAPAKTTRKKK